MITEDDDPRMLEAGEELRRRTVRICAGRGVSTQLCHDLLTMRDDHRTRWRQRGVDFPLMVLFCIPRLGIIKWWRADAEAAAVRANVLNFVGEARMSGWDVQPHDIAGALRAAYPGLRSLDALIDEGDRVQVQRATVQ